MEKRIIAAVIFILGGVLTNRAVAQPEIRYPNPAYLHWEEPCDLAYRWNSGGDLVWFPGITHYYRDFIWTSFGEEPYTKNGCVVNPFGTAGAGTPPSRVCTHKLY